MPNVTMPNGDVVSFPNDMPKTEIRALIEKKFPNAARQSLADTGEKPYQNMAEAAAVGVKNLPADIAMSKAGIGRGVVEALQYEIDPAIQKGRTPPLEVTPGAPIEDLLNQPAAATEQGWGLGGRLPEDIKRTLAMPLAKESLAQQLRYTAAQETKTPLDVAPGSMEEIAAATTGSIAEMAPLAIASVAIRNPAPLVTWFTGRSYGSEYGKVRDEGGSVQTAQTAAALYAAAEAATEAIAGRVITQGGKSLLGSILKGGAVEGMTEGATEALQALVDAGVVGEQMTLDEVLNRIKVASAAGAMAGSGVSAVTHGARSIGGKEAAAAEATPATPVAPEAVIADEPIENQMALPAPDTLLALPSPEMFAPPPIHRRQAQLAPDEPLQAQFGRDGKPRDATLNPDGTISSPGAERDEAEYQARVALQRSRQAETKELLQTARETITPLGTFSTDEIGGPAAQRVNQRRIQLGRSLDAPVTIDELANAKVPQAQIDAIISARRPATSTDPLTALDITRAAKAKNIIGDDGNFGELAYRTTGSRDPMRMTQTQLRAFKDVLDTMPAHAKPVTVPIADQPSYTEDQYGKALDAVRNAGRYTAKAIKDATGLKNTKDVVALRDAMVRRGQLVQRSPNDFRLYDVLGQERQATPDDVPNGAFKDYVVRRIPVSKVRVRQDGKAVGVFGSASEARSRVSSIRAGETDKRSEIAIEPAEETAWGVLENRYDESGNLLGQVIVDSSRDEAAMRRAADQMSRPDTGAQYTQTSVEVPPKLESEPVRRAPAPEALAGRTEEVLKRLNKLASERKLPLIGARVTLKPTVQTPDGRDIEGMYFNKLLSLSAANLTTDMTTDQVVDQLAQIMDHELIHALRQAGVLGPKTEGWNTILRYARRAKRPGTSQTYFEWAKHHYTGERGYENPDTIEEEAIAEAFRHWAANKRNVVGKPGTVFSQIVEWFKRLIRSVPDDLFMAIETGRMVEEALSPPGAQQPRARATRSMQAAQQGVAAAQTAGDENAVRVKSREFLRARAQAREDRYGRSGPKTVLGTTPGKAYEVAPIMDRPAVAAIVDRFKEMNGVSRGRLMTLLPEDVGYLARVADAQQRAAHDPGNNAVAKAYRALIDETRAMWNGLGPLQVTAWTGDGAPYASPADLLNDVLAGRLKIRPTADMFGPGADNAGHPLNNVSGVKTVDGLDLTHNDLLRVVHDIYGHGQSGYRDDPRGQYNAYHEHARLLSPEAARALATETLAQGSWANYGPHLRRKDGTVPRASDVDYLPPAQKEFAEQKAFLLSPDLLAADPGWALAEKADVAVNLDEAPTGWGAVDTLPPQLTQDEKAELEEIVRRVSGLDKVKWHDRIIVNRFDEGWGKHVAEATGYYDPTADVVAMTTQWGNPRAAYHEAFHRLQWKLLNESERKLLRAEEGPMRDMLRRNNATNRDIDKMELSEVEAEAFALWATNAEPAPKGAARVWQQIKDMLARAGNFLSGHGYRIPADIFAAAKLGVLAARSPRSAAGRAAAKQLMVAYHGTPHKVDKFSSSKIGTGEGAQAFGYGLYFAGKKEVADHYRQALAGRGGIEVDGRTILTPPDESMVPEEMVAELFALHDGKRDRVKHELEFGARDKHGDDAYRAAHVAALKWLDGHPNIKLHVNEGNLYKVDIPEDNELLDFDKPMREHTRAIRDKVADLLGTDIIDDMSGRDVYDTLSAKLRKKKTAAYGWDVVDTASDSSDFSGNKAASRALAQAGIPGNSYLDGASRATGDGTRNYVIYDDSRISILEENPKFSKFADDLPGGRLYGNPNRSPGGALSKPGTASPALTNPRPGNQYFGGELAEHQLQMARTGDRGAALVYLSPDDFLALTDGATNPEQEVYNASIDAGYKFAGYPSLVLDGYAGNVRAVQSDGTFAARALMGKAGPIPVVLYPKRAEGLGRITALEGPDGVRVAFPNGGFQEFDPSVRGPRYSVGSPEFRRWFGDSKVVDENGRPLVMHHGSPVSGITEFKGKTEFSEVAGTYFTPQREVAEKFGTVGSRGKPATVYPVYLSIQNPADRETMLLAGMKAGSPEGGRQALMRQGYDGVQDGENWVAFEPTQIKSAVNNNGQYDIANPDIRYSLNAPFGERVPSDPPNGVFNILQQRTEGAVGRFINSLGRSKRSVLGLPSIFDARVKMQDKMLSIKEMIEQIKANGGSVTDLNDTYMLEQLYHGKVFEQIREREQELQLPLLEALKAAHDGPRKITPKEFEDYLYARHAPERNAYLRTRGAVAESPSGMSDAEASAILDKVALDGKMPEMMALEALARRITTNTTATRIEGGLISPDTESPYQHYVPLRGFAEEDLDPDQPTENQTRARSGKGFSVGGREDRSVTGRTRKAGDLLGHLFLQNTEAVIRAEKNQVALSFLRLLQENPQAGFGQILKTAPTRLVAGANGMIHAAGDPSYRQAPDIVTAKYKGKEIIAKVVDPRLARAIKSDYVTTSNDIVNWLVNKAGMLNRYLATINTAWNPEFLISNLARDAQTAGILAQQYDIPQLGRKILGNAPKAMAGIREVLRDGIAEGDWAKTFLEMQKAGGTTEFLGIHDLETQVRGIRRSVTATGLNVTARKAFEHISKVGKFVGDYNKVAENAFRLSAYRAAREAGATIPQSAYLAKNLTINFNKGGELKGFMNAMYLFYNASTQGTAVLMNGLKSKRVQKIVAAVVVMGVLQDLLNRAISGDEDDNGVTDYDDIPDYVLETNFVLMDPLGLLKSIGIDKGYIAIPMPYGFNAFYNLGRNMSAGLSGSPVRNPMSSAVDSVMTFASAFNPLGGVQSIWNFIAPTIADPFVDIITNKDFAGNDIVPERPSFGLPVPESQKYWSNTGDIPKDTAAWLNSVTGGNEVRKGAADISPEVLQYALDYATGAVGKFTQRVAKLATETGPQALQGDFADIEIGDIPFARRVVGSISNRGATERYYQVAGEVKTVAAEMKLFEEDGNIEAARAKIRSQPVEVQLIDAFEDADKSLQDLRKQLRDLRENENIPEPRKREIEKRLKEAQDRLMAQMTKLYFTRKSAVANRP